MALTPHEQKTANSGRVRGAIRRLRQSRNCFAPELAPAHQLGMQSRAGKKALPVAGSPASCKSPTPTRSMARIPTTGSSHNRPRQKPTRQPQAGTTMSLESTAPPARLPSLFLADPRSRKIGQGLRKLQAYPVNFFHRRSALLPFASEGIVDRPVALQRPNAFTNEMSVR